MKILLKSIIIFFLTLSTLVSCQKLNQLTTVSNVDLTKYSGVWYSIASYPQFFERGSSNVRATYTAKENYIEVYNQSTKDGEPNDIKGKAYVVENSGNAKLKVQFFWPFRGNYWIIDLASDYTWAVVSDPKMKTLWILSRTPKMDNTLYDNILTSLIKRGFDQQRIVKMVQQ